MSTETCPHIEAIATVKPLAWIFEHLRCVAELHEITRTAAFRSVDVHECRVIRDPFGETALFAEAKAGTRT